MDWFQEMCQCERWCDIHRASWLRPPGGWSSFMCPSVSGNVSTPWFVLNFGFLYLKYRTVLFPWHGLTWKYEVSQNFFAVSDKLHQWYRGFWFDNALSNTWYCELCTLSIQHWPRHIYNDKSCQCYCTQLRLFMKDYPNTIVICTTKYSICGHLT